MQSTRPLYTYFNPQAACSDGSVINVDIDHPEFGWVPYSAVKDEGAAEQKEFFATLAADPKLRPFVPPTLDAMRRDAQEQAKQRRKRAEQGGTTVNGQPIATDRDAQGQAFRLAAAGKPVPYKASNGLWLENANAAAISAAIQAHVEACFKREKELSALFEAATSGQELAKVFKREIDQGWPSTATPKE